MRNVVVQLEYDGTHFVGSQSQAQGRTVQDELERAWMRLAGEDRRWTFAGRTDAGVHAQGQVANVRTETAHSLTTIQRAMNALLPADITVRKAWEADLAFHARSSAVRRDYRYTILNEALPAALLRTTTWHIATVLDVAAMDEAARQLEGRHDFAAFGVVDRGSTVRECFTASCTRHEQGPYRLVIVELAANGFLRHMVRAVVGTLVEVGKGRRTADSFASVLASCDRSKAGSTAPPHGLSLVSVTYPEQVRGDIQQEIQQIAGYPLGG